MYRNSKQGASFKERLVEHCSYDVEEPFTRAAYYFGHKHYTYPANYLKSIRHEDIKSELATTKQLGFNTIILTVCWAEFEPSIGESCDTAYTTLETIIHSAQEIGLDTFIRAPYLWSLQGGDVTNRLLYALLDHGSYRQELLNFLAHLSSTILTKYPSVKSVFGSWEDFYLPVKSAFFAKKSTVSLIVREHFFRKTQQSADIVVENGENCDLFYNWIDREIQSLVNEIADYGYEIRVDDDPYLTSEGNLGWHSHGAYYHSGTSGKLLSYWAPYFGAINQGEIISAKKACQTLNIMLRKVAIQSPVKSIVNQFNFFDNTEGADHHASIERSQWPLFFKQSAALLVAKSAGYGIWTSCDYRHNVIIDSTFVNEALYWIVKGPVEFSKDGVLLKSGSEVQQFISTHGLSAAGKQICKLFVCAQGGRGYMLIDSPNKESVRFEFNTSYDIDLYEFEAGLTIRLKGAESTEGDGVVINSVVLYGHVQEGGPIDVNGAPSEIYPLIKTFNRQCIRAEKRKK